MYKKLKRKQNIVDACEKQKTKKERRKNMTAMQKVKKIKNKKESS